MGLLAHAPLDTAAKRSERAKIPEQQKENPHNKRQNSYCPMFGFYENFPEAVHEGGNPQEPLQEGRYHDQADDGRVYDLESERSASMPLAAYREWKYLV